MVHRHLSITVCLPITTIVDTTISYTATMVDIVVYCDKLLLIVFIIFSDKQIPLADFLKSRQ